ncbi:fumarylacetoacetate hydrolase family protein [Paracoccus salsus]|uniref:fumarylacetoacetate hydrolase family protein n=1 Tax=Paracoccus salsus TaxID=2911061 RepID=UPI001F33E808|nr:fumarylacetoacetate hydrolase family protein [Paracoccus salsus]MCF3972159.1 fumarylacetoacetate hydrolase family protein [Paracoccus salsus]
MSGYVLPPPAQPSVPVAGNQARFAVRRIFCVGRNYAEHAREMGHDPDREPPFFFSKPTDALLTDGAELAYPPLTADLHFEAEMVIAIGQGGTGIAPGEALSHVWGCAAGVDFTRRDLQAEAKRLGRPWDMAKGFDGSAACGALNPVAQTGVPTRGAIRLEVDGDLRQQGDLAQMIWSVPEVIAHLSRLVALAPGDLIYTGTPSGVGAVARGETIRVEIEGLSALAVRVT